jgi:lipoyl(octanoyl) transferase
LRETFFSMNEHVQYLDWGLVDYAAAWERQRQLFAELLAQKERRSAAAPQRFIVCEHPHVYTLGRNGKANNLLIGEDFLRKINATDHRVERGGDITYHGPGQLVGYPILDLEPLHLSLREYVFMLEEAIIRTLAGYRIGAGRMDGATGVWLEAGGASPRKICAIGVRASRYVTMHGFALNVSTNLSYFSYINPCGFVDKGVTSLERELQRSVSMEEVKRRVYAHFVAQLPAAQRNL